MTVKRRSGEQSLRLLYPAVFEEALLEAWAGDCGFHQLRIDGAQGIEVVLFTTAALTRLRIGIAHLRFFALRRIAFAVAAGKGFFKDKPHIQFGAPAEAFGKRQRQRITVVDLGKQERIRRIDTVAADHARMDVQRHQRP